MFLDHAVVGLRHPARRALFRLSAGVMAGFRATLNGVGFTEIQTPKLVASATESGANVFGVDYFGRRAYLAQSPQFYKQIMVGVFERVYEVGPVFRAEPHDTVRHINEYVSLDVEMGFIRIIRRDGDAARGDRGILGHLKTHYAPSWRCSRSKLPAVPSADPGHLLPGGAGADPGSARARIAAASPTWRRSTSAGWANGRRRRTAATFCSSPAIRWSSGHSTPTRTRPTRATPTRSTCSSGAPSWSPAGSGCTCTRTTWIPRASHGYTDLAPFETYFETFRYGMPPHGGFAIGLERFIMQLLGLDNIRLATLFPRGS